MPPFPTSLAMFRLFAVETSSLAADSHSKSAGQAAEALPLAKAWRMMVCIPNSAQLQNVGSNLRTARFTFHIARCSPLPMSGPPSSRLASHRHAAAVGPENRSSRMQTLKGPDQAEMWHPLFIPERLYGWGLLGEPLSNEGSPSLISDNLNHDPHACPCGPKNKHGI